MMARSEATASNDRFMSAAAPKATPLANKSDLNQMWSSEGRPK